MIGKQKPPRRPFGFQAPKSDQIDKILLQSMNSMQDSEVIRPSAKEYVSQPVKSSVKPNIFFKEPKIESDSEDANPFAQHLRVTKSPVPPARGTPQNNTGKFAQLK